MSIRAYSGIVRSCDTPKETRRCGQRKCFTAARPSGDLQEACRAAARKVGIETLDNFTASVVVETLIAGEVVENFVAVTKPTTGGGTAPLESQWQPL